MVLQGGNGTDSSRQPTKMAGSGWGKGQVGGQEIWLEAGSGLLPPLSSRQPPLVTREGLQPHDLGGLGGLWPCCGAVLSWRMLRGIPGPALWCQEPWPLGSTDLKGCSVAKGPGREVTQEES